MVAHARRLAVTSDISRRARLRLAFGTLSAGLGLTLILGLAGSPAGAASAPSVGDLDGSAINTEILSLVDARTAPAAAGRGQFRAAVPGGDVGTHDDGATFAGNLLPVVLATPAPIPCEFTGLGHIAHNDPWCTNPAHNSPEQNQALGKYLAARRGWADNQWQCLDSLMIRESRWRHAAANPVSAARGIPQKMMSVHYGANWRTSPVAAHWMANPEPQIEWGLDYIARRYGDPCGAWAFFQRNGWY